MSLSKLQKKRVRAVLEAGVSVEVAARLPELESPEELHQFVLNYNVNDGREPIWFLIRSPLCDLGTALYTYWLFDQTILGRREDPEVKSKAERECQKLIVEIEQRFFSGFYTHRDIAFDPRKELKWTEEEQRLLELGEFSFPPEMLEVTPGRPLKTVWFE